MDVKAFDVASTEEARGVIEPCAAIPRWVDDLVGGRPYGTLDTLLDRADTLARTWTTDEVAGALAQHPRIGERHRGTGTEAAMSAREQSAVGTDEVLAERLRTANAAYEERFGHVFLIRAAGRSGEEILDALQRRLGNDPAAELIETATQLREIAVLRLRAALS